MYKLYGVVVNKAIDYWVATNEEEALNNGTKYASIQFVQKVDGKDLMVFKENNINGQVVVDDYLRSHQYFHHVGRERLNLGKYVSGDIQLVRWQDIEHCEWSECSDPVRNNLKLYMFNRALDEIFLCEECYEGKIPKDLRDNLVLSDEGQELKSIKVELPNHLINKLQLESESANQSKSEIVEGLINQMDDVSIRVIMIDDMMFFVHEDPTSFVPQSIEVPEGDVNYILSYPEKKFSTTITKGDLELLMKAEEFFSSKPRDTDMLNYNDIATSYSNALDDVYSLFKDHGLLLNFNKHNLSK